MIIYSFLDRIAVRTVPFEKKEIFFFIITDRFPGDNSPQSKNAAVTPFFNIPHPKQEFKTGNKLR